MADCRTFKVNAVKDFVGGVVRSDDSNENDGTTGEGDVLPRTTCDFGTVEDHVPLLLVKADLDEVGVGPLVAVPQQEPEICIFIQCNGISIT